MTPIVGRRLGRYEVEQEIGRGGMARVYRAVDTLLQRSVAIKVLAPQLSIDPEFTRRFEREAITAANLRHPAIVTVYDVGEQDGLHYIAMEFIRGRTLHSVLTERGALGLGYAVSLLEPVSRALDFAHSQGSVHRDIKPHNIMVDVEGRVLLTDFGIAQVAETDTSERLTRTGIFMGTPEYLSPEQAEAQRVDGRSDLYSLGIVGYEIITGRVPFSGATPQLIVAHAQKQPPPPSSVVADVPGELDDVLAKALAKNPQSRYATGTALVEALRIVARRNHIPLATTKQIAELAVPHPRPTGQGDAATKHSDGSFAPVPVPEPQAALTGAATPVGMVPTLPGGGGRGARLAARGTATNNDEIRAEPPLNERDDRRARPIFIFPLILLVALVGAVLVATNVFGTGTAPPPTAAPTAVLPTNSDAGIITIPATTTATAPLATATSATATASPTVVTASPTITPTATAERPTEPPVVATRARTATRRPAPPAPTATDMPSTATNEPTVTVPPYPAPVDTATAEPQPTEPPPTEPPPTEPPPTKAPPTRTPDPINTAEVIETTPNP